MFSDDAVSVKIDAGHDHRTTLGFVLNPAGARLDYRGLDESSFKAEFDAVWEGAAARTPEGWSAEMRIPFSELGLSTGELPERIGFNLTRDHSRSNATYDWSLSPPPYGPIAASRYGHLVGLDAGREGEPGGDAGRSSRPGVSWAIAPYVLGGFERRRPAAEQEPELDLRGDAGADAELRYGARGRAQLTVNTDFAQVDLDDQIVNLGRFSLFMPEKRDFFLEDAEIFSFGRPGSAQAFHSRRIGLDRRSTVPILAGAKVVDRPAPGIRLGLLDVVTRPEGDLPWTSHLVSRAQYQLGDGSHAGAILTHRQSFEAGDDRNLVAGFDGALRGTGSPLLLEAFALLSHTADRSRRGSADVADTAGSTSEGSAESLGVATALDLAWRDELIRPSLGYGFTSETFRADLGFFERTGVHQGTAEIAVEPRIGRDGLERFTFTLSTSLIAAAEDAEILDWNTEAVAMFRWDAGFFLGATGEHTVESVRAPFGVGSGTEIPAGRYAMDVVRLHLGTPQTWMAGGTSTLTRRDYYGGEMLRCEAGAHFRPGPLLRLEATADLGRVRFRSRDLEGFDSAALNLRAAIGLSPDLGLSLFAGRSNRPRDLLVTQARLRWTWRPGSDLVVVYAHDEDLDGGARDYQSLLVKLTMRFMGG